MPNLWHSLKNRKNTRIILNLKNTADISSNLCSVLGLILEKIKSKNNEIYFRNIPYNIKNILLKNEFLKSMETETFHWDRYDFLAYKKFDIKEKKIFEKYLIEKLGDFNKDNLLNFNIKDTVRAISEMFVNIKMHTNSREVVTCGYYDKDKKEMYFTISNHGTTIAKTIERKNNYIFKKDIEAIEWAVKKASSTRRYHETGGLGLYTTREFLKEISGEMWIVSGRGYWHESIEKLEKEELKSSFPGTFITFLFPVNYITNAESVNKNVISIEDILGEELW